MASSSVKITKTTTSTSSHGGGGGSYSTYKPTTAARSSAVSRSLAPMSSGGGSGYSRQMIVSYGSSMGGGMGAGGYDKVASHAAESIARTKDKEKRDMQDLNERFAGYIEKVRFLEAQNRKLGSELEQLKNKWGKETAAVKEMYEIEMKQSRDLLDQANEEKAKIELRMKALEDELEDVRRRLAEALAERDADREIIDRQNVQLSDYESELSLLRRRLEIMERDLDNLKRDKQRLTEENNRLKAELDHETLARVCAENEKQSLQEELEFMKSVHEQELKELAALAYRDTTAENREFWKNELSSAIREIQQEYDNRLDGMRGELEAFYNVKVQEFKTGTTRQNMELVHAHEEISRLKNQLTDLRPRLNDYETKCEWLTKQVQQLQEQLEESETNWAKERMELQATINDLTMQLNANLAEIQRILDSKLSLELEIAAYRKLLEGEENRMGNLKTMVESTMESYSSGGGSMMSGGGGMGGGGGMMAQSTSKTYSSRTVGGGQHASETITISGGGQMMGHQMTGGDTYTYMIPDDFEASQSVVKGEMSAKTTYQRSAKGPCSISDVDTEGNYITIENTGRKEEELGGYKVVRKADGQKPQTFVFPENIKIAPRQKIKIAGKGKSGDFQLSHESQWALGSNVATTLQAPSGEDRATHLQKTMYSS